MAEIKVGQKVRVLIDSPAGEPVDGVVKIVNDEKKNPGKVIGVELNNFALTGHTLEGALDASAEKVDPTNGQRFGKGWWTREENLEII